MIIFFYWNEEYFHHIHKIFVMKVNIYVIFKKLRMYRVYTSSGISKSGKTSVKVFSYRKIFFK